MSSERVLCIPRSRFEHLGAFEGICAQSARFLPAMFEAPHPLFIARSECETDPSHKQLIPYILVQWRGQLLRYLRGGKGGEARLHAKASLGIGGHVNDDDGTDPADAEHIFALGLQRELKEELETGDAVPELEPLGLINDDSDPVGQVHLGVVYLARYPDDADIRGRDEAIESPEFLTPAAIEARPEELESWSQLALRLYRDYV